MHISNDDEKPSIDEALEHYGVKGMRWGVRKKAPSGAEIQKARRSVRRSQEKLSKAEDRRDLAKGKKAQAKAQKDYDKATMEFLMNPDRATAVRMSAGEKVAVAILATPVTALTTSVVSNVRANQITKKQQTGGYDKYKKGNR